MSVTARHAGADRSRNNLVPAVFRPYVYRGLHRTLTEQDRAADAGHQRPPDGKCPDCGYARTGRNHRALCGGGTRGQ